MEREQKEKQSELGTAERRLLQREEGLARKVSGVERRELDAQKREESLAQNEQGLAVAQATCEKTAKEFRQALERVAGQSDPSLSMICLRAALPGQSCS